MTAQYALLRPDANGTRPYRTKQHWSRDAGIHWAAYLIAREHKLQQGDNWTCDCACCYDVRQLIAAAPPAKAAAGGVS